MNSNVYSPIRRSAFLTHAPPSLFLVLFVCLVIVFFSSCHRCVMCNVQCAGCVRGVPAGEGAQRCAVGADDGEHYRLPHGVPGALRPARREPAVQVRDEHTTALNSARTFADDRSPALTSMFLCACATNGIAFECFLLVYVRFTISPADMFLPSPSGASRSERRS